MLELATARTAGHPTWHLVVVALASVAVFVGIKVEEHVRAHPWDRSKGTVGRDGLILTMAVCSAGAAVIHASVCSEHFQEFFAFGVFFVIAAALQAGWAVAICLHPTRELLLAGTIGNISIILVWAVSRTVGVPIGPEVWHPEVLSALDVTASVLEVGVVVGVAALLTRLQHYRRDAWTTT